MDTAKLTAAVETLQEYCEQVRLVMNAKGYLDGHANVDIGLGGADRFQVWVFSVRGSCKSFSSWDGDAFAAALAYAESLPPAHTPATIAATLGITPDGRVLEEAR